jgi:hypothetical protein
VSALGNPHACQEAAKSQAKGWVVRTIRCRINVAALQAFVAQHGDMLIHKQQQQPGVVGARRSRAADPAGADAGDAGAAARAGEGAAAADSADGAVGSVTSGNVRTRTYRAAAEALLAETCFMEEETGGNATFLDLEYRYSALGRSLVEAGHVTCSREYAKGEDPFKWPSDLRDAALGDISTNVDIVGCYQNVRLAMIPEGKAAVERFLSRREAVLAAIGRYLWPDESTKERRKRAKGVINAYDMGAGIDFWTKIEAWGRDPRKRSLRGVNLVLGDESGPQYKGTKYSVSEYHAAQGRAAQWVAARSESMMDFIRAHFTEKQRREKRADLTAASYILQEAEATSREAKIKYCVANGIEVLNLQHDGIVVFDVIDQNTADAMGAAATAACGHPVRVEAKRIEVPAGLRE